MTKLHKNIIKAWNAISDSLTGEYDIENKEVKQMRKEVLSKDISPKADRRNLNNDSKTVIKDYKKALKQRKVLMDG